MKQRTSFAVSVHRILTNLEALCPFRTSGQYPILPHAEPMRWAGTFINVMTAGTSCMFTMPAVTGAVRLVIKGKQRTGLANASLRYCRLITSISRQPCQSSFEASSESNQKDMYSLFFSIASDAILELIGDEKYLHAKAGMLAVLHTWTGELHYHPHIHFLVTGGGIDDQGGWISSKPRFLIPVMALSKLIRGKFAYHLRKKHPEIYYSVDNQVWQKEWVCNSIHYGKGSKAVLNYLSRYVHRVAITNSRILDIDDEYVTFRYKDRKAKQFKICKVPGEEFMCRYLRHILPKGFHKVRYYGIWHSSHKHHVPQAYQADGHIRGLPTAAD